MRVLACLHGASLDAALAAGTAPESCCLLAARAQAIVTPCARRSIAASWEHLLRVADRDGHYPAVRSRAVPVCADQIAAAEPAVRELIARLTAAAPVPARGVAMARMLLTDATSPVYQRRARTSLLAAVESAAAQLDPALPLLPA
jgi:hypothetical protein